MKKNHVEREFNEADLDFVLGGCSYAAQEYYLGHNAEAGSDVAKERHEEMSAFLQKNGTKD